MQRFAACDFARDVVRGLFNEREVDPSCGRVQVLACYFLQLFFMFRSLRQEDAKVVAVAAAFLACKIVDVPRRMRDLLRTHNSLRAKAGEAELDEEEQKALRDRILKVEFLLLRIIRFDFDVELPLEQIDSLADRLLARLAMSTKFREACAGRQPVVEANALKPKLVQVAKSFMNDAFMGLGPLLVPPRVIAAGALAVAVRYVRREFDQDELHKLLEAVDRSLAQPQVKTATDEIFNVYRTKNGLQAAAAAAKPAGGAAAATSSTATASKGAANVAAPTQGVNSAATGLASKAEPRAAATASGAKAVNVDANASVAGAAPGAGGPVKPAGAVGCATLAARSHLPNTSGRVTGRAAGEGTSGSAAVPGQGASATEVAGAVEAAGSASARPVSVDGGVAAITSGVSPQQAGALGAIPAVAQASVVDGAGQVAKGGNSMAGPVASAETLPVCNEVARSTAAKAEGNGTQRVVEAAAANGQLAAQPAHMAQAGPAGDATAAAGGLAMRPPSTVPKPRRSHPYARPPGA